MKLKKQQHCITRNAGIDQKHFRNLTSKLSQSSSSYFFPKVLWNSLLSNAHFPISVICRNKQNKTSVSNTARILYLMKSENKGII